MAHGIGESGFLPLQDRLGQVIPLKGMAQQVFTFAVHVHLLRRVDAHDVFHEFQIPKGHPGLQTVDGDAPVRPQHIVHVQFPDALLGLLLERLGTWGKVGVFITKQFIADLAGEENPDIALLVDGLAQ